MVQTKASILIAEDDTFLANAYRMKLKKAGYKVTIARDGEEAIKKVKEEKPDLILLDLVMPNKDGFETLEALKKDAKHKDVPVVITSNLGQKEDIEKCKKLGARDYIVKSDIALEELVGKIEEYLS